MNKKSTNPFVTKKSILNLMKKKKNKTLPIAKPKVPKKDKEIVEETSIYTRPGEPYNVIATVISCTPVIPVMYKLYAAEHENIDMCVPYKNMYEFYKSDTGYLSIYYEYITIIIGLKVEMDITNKDRVITIKKALDRFISDWSTYYGKKQDNSISMNHNVRDDDIEEVDILVYGSLDFYRYYFNTIFDGINPIGNEILKAIASSNLIYRDILLDEESVAGANMNIRSMFMDPDIQSKIDAEQYDSSELKTYIDSLYNSTKDCEITSLIYIDNIDNIKKNLKEFFGENYDVLFDVINHIYYMINILYKFKDPRYEYTLIGITMLKLYEYLYNWFSPNLKIDKDNGNTIYNDIRKALEDHFDFKINMYNQSSFYPSYREQASYDDVDEVVEEQEVL